MRRQSKTSSTSASANAAKWAALIKLVLDLIIALLGKSKAKASDGAGKASSRTDCGSVRPGRNNSTRASETDATTGKPSSPSRSSNAGTLRELFANRTSDAMVVAVGQIVKVLPDDMDDSDGSGHHQRFLVEIDDELTIKISHNIKFGRVPASQGDQLRFKGEYEWNELGGCIHWTHHDPIRRHEDGWIEHDGKRYG